MKDFNKILETTDIEDITCVIYNRDDYVSIPHGIMHIMYYNDLNVVGVFIKSVRKFKGSFEECQEKIQDRIILEKMKTL